MLPAREKAQLRVYITNKLALDNFTLIYTNVAICPRAVNEGVKLPPGTILTE